MMVQFFVHGLISQNDVFVQRLISQNDGTILCTWADKLV